MTPCPHLDRRLVEPAVAAPISLPTTTSEPSAPPAPQSSWSFPLSFWTANVIELCERAAYYGWFILVTVYLTSSVGYSDIQAGYITGCSIYCPLSREPSPIASVIVKP